MANLYLEVYVLSAIRNDCHKKKETKADLIDNPHFFSHLVSPRQNRVPQPHGIQPLAMVDSGRYVNK